ncbi:MAG: NYN domain-containing protein [Lentisphaeria bacterium]|nr:NYN domain-containing protein [Lentisphaeria bacterium]
MKKTAFAAMPDSHSSQLTVRALLESCDAKHLFHDLPLLGIHSEWLFMKGYKPSPGALRKTPVQIRLVQAMLKDTPTLMGFLTWEKAPWTIDRQRLTALDEAWLLRHWRDILRTSRGLMTAAAMAADDRPRIAARGHRMIRKPFPWHLTPAPKDTNMAVDALFTSPPPLENRPGSGDDKRIRRQLDQATASVDRLKKNIADLRGQVRLLTRELDNERDTHRREINKLTTKLARQGEAAEDLARNRVAAYRASLFAGVTAMEDRWRTARDMTTERLAEKARNLLKRQAENDVTFGTRRKLDAEREKLIQLKNRVSEALSDAINPLPELSTLHSELREKIDVLNHLLSSGSSDTAFVSVEDLEDCIRRAERGKTGVAVLRAAEDVLTNPLGEQLFSPQQRDALRRAVNARRDWLNMLERESLLARAEPPAPAADDTPRQLFNLRAALKTAPRRPSLIVDGYNVIKNDAFPLAGETERQSEARNYLEKALADVLDPFAEVRIVYDGPGQLTSVEKKRGVQVVFARLRGEGQQADDAIVDWLSTRAAAHPAWLVTNDNGLRSRATPFCAAFIAAEDFIDYLRGL